MRKRAVICGLFLLLFFPLVVHGLSSIDYFPLVLDAKWEYENPSLKTSDIIYSTKKITGNHTASEFLCFDLQEDVDFLGISNSVVHSYAYDIHPNFSRILEIERTTRNQLVGVQSHDFNPPLITLRDPLKVGCSWWVGNDGNGYSINRKIVKFETINTPAGTFTNCIKIREDQSVDGKPFSSGYYWYAPNVGLVKGITEGKLVEYNIPSTNR